MSQADYDLIQSGLERRLAAVETLIPSRPVWRSADDLEIRPALHRVVAGPALRQSPATGRRMALLLAVSALIVLMVGYGLLGGGGQQDPLPSASVPTPTAVVSAGPTDAPGTLRPMVEPRLIIPVRPTTAWTVVEDGVPYLNLVFFLEELGLGGYNVSLTVFEPLGVYDPIVETTRLPLPPDLISWIRDHPDVEAGEPFDLTVAGLPARAIDVTVTYRSGGSKGQTAQFIDDGIGSWNLEFPGKKRIVLVDLPDRPLLIVFGSRPEFFDNTIRQFEEELARIQFDQAGPAP